MIVQFKRIAVRREILHGGQQGVGPFAEQGVTQVPVRAGCLSRACGRTNNK